MPEAPNPKIRRHPWEAIKAPSAPVSAEPVAGTVPAPAPVQTPGHASGQASGHAAHSGPRRPLRRDGGAYAELQVATNFTFLTGASHPDELVERACELGLRAIAITDLHSVAGIVRAHVAAREAGMPLMVGATVELQAGDERPVRALLHATSRTGYATLCRLLTIGKRRAAKGECRLLLHDLLEHNNDLLITILPPRRLDGRVIAVLEGLRHWINHRGRRPLGPGRGDDRLSIAASCRFDGDDQARLVQLRHLAAHVDVPLVAVNDVLYHVPARQHLQDVLTCIRNGCTLHAAGMRLEANAERSLKPAAEMRRLFAPLPGAVERTVELADRATGFSLDELRYEYPEEVVPPGVTPMEHLRALTWAGAAQRYPHGVPERVRRQIEHEFALIDELRYAPYFLTVQDLCRFARSRRILHQGRGAAANSAVCFCLGVTAVDPDRIDVLFERFLSRERNEPPDIDIDFEHERREEVIQYIYRKYGRDRAALTAEVITYRGRSAVRDVGKALGLSLDCVDRLARDIDWWSDGTVDPSQLRALSLSPEDPTIRQLVAMTGELLGFPRHLSQHVGGFVITRGLLCEMVPVENAAMPDRTVIEWDKDDIDAMGMLKVDVLGLGMLTCLRKAMTLATPPVSVTSSSSSSATPPSLKRSGRRGASIEHVTATATRVRVSADVVDDLEVITDGDVDVVVNTDIVADAGVFDRIDDHEATVDDAPGDRSPDKKHKGDKPQDDKPQDDKPQDDKPRDDKPRDDEPDDRLSPAPSVIAARGGSGFSPGPRLLSLASIPPEDPAVYDMICRADTIGVFQIESRAQMSMLPRLRPRCFYDLVIEVAIVRPGPIQGDMVHPYLRRRDGLEPVSYPDEAVRRVLSKTLGVPLFQEQAMSLAIVAAGFTPGEADQLRRAIAAWKSRGNKIAYFGERIMNGMMARGYSRTFAEQCFTQIKGFSGYGFPESHAASFALLVYASAWLKRYHPAAFAAALINSQPMGFYAPAQIIRDAQEHGVEVRRIDVNRSDWDCTLEWDTGKPTSSNVNEDVLTNLRRDGRDPQPSPSRAHTWEQDPDQDRNQAEARIAGHAPSRAAGQGADRAEDQAHSPERDTDDASAAIADSSTASPDDQSPDGEKALQAFSALTYWMLPVHLDERERLLRQQRGERGRDDGEPGVVFPSRSPSSRDVGGLSSASLSPSPSPSFSPTTSPSPSCSRTECPVSSGASGAPTPLPRSSGLPSSDARASDGSPSDSSLAAPPSDPLLFRSSTSPGSSGESGAHGAEGDSTSNGSTGDAVAASPPPSPSPGPPTATGRAGPALRLGLRMVRGLSEEDGQRLAETVRRYGPIRNVADLHRLSGVRVAVLRRLAAADAFQSMGLDRQQAMWQVGVLRDDILPLFDQAMRHSERTGDQPDDSDALIAPNEGDDPMALNGTHDLIPPAHSIALGESEDTIASGAAGGLIDPGMTADPVARSGADDSISLRVPGNPIAPHGPTDPMEPSDSNGRMNAAGVASTGRLWHVGGDLTDASDESCVRRRFDVTSVDATNVDDTNVDPASVDATLERSGAGDPDERDPDATWAFASSDDERTPVQLPPVPPLRAVAHDYAATGVSLRPHPITYIRPLLDRRRVLLNRQLADERTTPHGRRVAVAGLVLVRQRPGTAKGIVFMTIEDESSIANLVLHPAIYQQFRRAARHAVAILARGVVERAGEVVHVVVRRVEDIGPLLAEVQTRSRDFH